MTHATDSLSAYLDRELAPDETLRVKTHLADCADCRTRLDELSSVSRLLSGMSKAPLPAGFMPALKTRKAAAAPVSSSWLELIPRRQAAFALAGAAGVIVAFDALSDRMPHQMPVMGAASSSNAAARSVAPIKRSAALPKDAPAPPAAAQPTNQDLAQFLEGEKKRMGIRKVLDRQAESLAVPAGFGPTARSAAFLSGTRPGLLKDMRVGASESPLTLEALELATGPAPGVWALDTADLADIWRRYAIPRPPPSVDFTREMLIVATALRDKPAEIVSIQREEARILVRYRLSPSLAAVPYPFALVPRSELPVVFELIP